MVNLSLLLLGLFLSNTCADEQNVLRKLSQGNYLNNIDEKEVSPLEQIRDYGSEGCTPGSMVCQECNLCTCGNHGELGCTKKACPSLSDLPWHLVDGRCVQEMPGDECSLFGCKPGSRCCSQCNLCFCGPDRDTYQCQKMACHGISGLPWIIYDDRCVQMIPEPRPVD